MGKLAATDRPCLRSLSHSFTLDLVVFSPTYKQAVAAQDLLSTWLGTRGLRLSDEKTQIPPNYVVEHFSHSSKATRGKDLQIEEAVCGGYAPAFHFHPTLPGMLGSTLIRDDVIIATHKTIDLVFRTQVYKLKRDMPMRSRS